MPIICLTYPQLRFQAFQSSLPTPTSFWRWAAVPAQKVCPWSAPWWVLRAFICVGCARSKPIVTRVSDYGAHYGARYGGALRGALRGTFGILICPDFNFMGLLSYHLKATIMFNVLFAQTPMKNRLTLLQAFC